MWFAYCVVSCVYVFALVVVAKDLLAYRRRGRQ